MIQVYLLITYRRGVGKPLSPSPFTLEKAPTDDAAVMRGWCGKATGLIGGNWIETDAVGGSGAMPALGVRLSPLKFVGGGQVG